jgi:D-alanyl-D-alanine carboxypeptidase-like protein
MNQFTLRQRNLRMKITIAIRFVPAYCWLIWLGTPALADPALDILVAAYPEQLAAHDDQNLVWKDGTRQPLSDGQAKTTFDDLLNHPSIVDQFAIRYRLGPQLAAPLVNEDPGRIRNEEFFRKMYGDCRKGEVADQLRPVAWLPHRGGGTILATKVNGIAEKLEQISAELEKLPPSMTRYAVPSAGTYNCRNIAGSNLVSMHSYGAAIDLNDKSGDYWRWNKKKDGTFIWRNRIPYPIVEIFERFGFVWGGKWYHFDTFHFEYRPEIINLARKDWVRN